MPQRLLKAGFLAAVFFVPTAGFAIYPYGVFFESGEAGLSAQDALVLEAAAEGILVNGFECLETQAGADRVGSSSYNLVLSRRRAEAVKDALVERGIKTEWMTLNPVGEDEPIVITEDGVAEAQNRYVLIIPKCRRADEPPSPGEAAAT